MTENSKQTRQGLTEIATPTRPQIVRDTFGRGVNSYESGKAPPGYVSTWDFSGKPNDSKHSPVSKPEKGSIYGK